MQQCEQRGSTCLRIEGEALSWECLFQASALEIAEMGWLFPSHHGILAWHRHQCIPLAWKLNSWIPKTWNSWFNDWNAATQSRWPGQEILPLQIPGSDIMWTNVILNFMMFITQEGQLEPSIVLRRIFQQAKIIYRQYILRFGHYSDRPHVPEFYQGGLRASDPQLSNDFKGRKPIEELWLTCHSQNSLEQPQPPEPPLRLIALPSTSGKTAGSRTLI